MLYKEIHIGELIKNKVEEKEVTIRHIAEVFRIPENTVLEMFEKPELSTGELLKWCKLLRYDFFRIYSQHLILYTPQYSNPIKKKEKTKFMQFRKNIYSDELIEFVLELIKTGKKTKQEIVDDYRIPRTTLYKWIAKHQVESDL
ncbi:transposase [Chryseobacterium sp. NRRL B-14859]|uniref:transposase n=1 Tax=unclassified Chryseobacterium TaxID=2593645 RepID=UPI000F44E448|nr:transposase [Chryseobacterium sp. G0240]ROI06680.1 transposase [Chryseobacterium sp. G0240]